MKKRTLQYLLSIIAAFCLLAFTGCEDRNDLGDQLEDAGDAVEDAADDVRD